jgi:hypothetical protein
MPSWLRWTLALTAACAALGTWLLITDIWLRLQGDPGAEQYTREMDRMQREYRQASITLTRLARLDTVRRLLPDSSRLVVSTGRDAPPEFEKWIAAGAAAEYAPAPSPRVPVIIAYGAGERFSNERVLNIGIRGGVDFLAGMDNGVSFCAVAGGVPSWSGNERWWTRYLTGLATRPLGPCRLWARYGAPGEAVRVWLAAGAMYFASDADPALPLPDSLRGRRIFGAHHERQLELGLEPCLAGNARRCREALLGSGAPGPAGPARLAGALVTSGGNDWFWSDWPPRAATRLLATLEAEFGAGRFARFWTASGDVETAFRDAFGTPLEVWAMRSLQAVYGRAPTGPRLAAGTLLLSFITLGLLAGVAVAVSRRRTVA